MFREMRRSGQKLKDEDVRAILRDGRTAVLALSGDDGYPYAVPVNYVCEGDKVYFHCAREGHKLDAIRRQDKVSMCVVAEDEVVPERLTTRYCSVILFGHARILESRDEMVHAAEALGMKYCEDKDRVDSAIRNGLNRLCCVEIVIDHITGKEGLEFARTRERNG